MENFLSNGTNMVQVGYQIFCNLDLKENQMLNFNSPNICRKKVKSDKAMKKEVLDY